jgi:hypothetical protein
MGVQVLKNQKLWFGGYDLTGEMNALGLDYAADLQDATAFGDATRVRLGGLKTVTAHHEGYFDADPYDQALFSNLGVKDVPMTFGAEGATEGNVGYSFLSSLAEYAPGGSIGEMFAFSVSAEASGSLIRGTLMHLGAKTATGNGTARQLGAVGASQKLYAALHVTAASGTSPTLDVTVESDDASGFPSPVTRITFAQKTAIGFEWKELAGAVADDWWRIAWAIGGTGPSFNFTVFLGIQ